MHTRKHTHPHVVSFITCNSREYLCHPHHRSSARAGQKSQWVVTFDAECHIFCLEEFANPTGIDSAGEVWSIVKDINRPLGTRGEILARFYPPSAGSREWHGHPVGRGSPGGIKTAPTSVVNEWAASGRIQRALAKKLRKQSL